MLRLRRQHAQGAADMATYLRCQVLLFARGALFAFDLALPCKKQDLTPRADTARPFDLATPCKKQDLTPQVTPGAPAAV